ncbi:MAG: DegT/DnrJ/EryC1/StrS family aminotransferase [Oscillospiraceae bacterium]|jgi:pyridoxal phosphate-dependent aminotransferase EpsN|nr:DegT/DnrJ/EryC1/StrS family aminotransferase [Oscillospiraceae bacterium]
MRLEKRIFLSPPHCNGQELEYLRQAVESNWVAPAGPHLPAFEQELCTALGGATELHGAALVSGTAAIHLGLRLLGVQPGDTVFCSDLTFAGSVNPVLYEGATPVFIDSEVGGCNMAPAALANAFAAAAAHNRLPRAAIIVDLYGQSAAWGQLLPLCAQYGVPVLEDAAEALGASYAGQACGTFGAVAAFSFNGNKIITTSGGGMLVTGSTESAEKIRFWASQSKEPAPYYLHRELGFNYRMSNLCAGVGRAQLLTLREHIARRGEIYAYYKEAFAGLPLQMLPAPAGSEPNNWLSIALLEPSNAPLTAQQLVDALEADNVEARRAWNPMHCQPVFAGYDYHTAEAGVCASEDFFARGVCLPSGSGMAEAELEAVATRVRRLLGGQDIPARSKT